MSNFFDDLEQEATRQKEQVDTSVLAPLLEQLDGYTAPEIPFDVEPTVEYLEKTLGKYPSIATLEAVVKVFKARMDEAKQKVYEILTDLGLSEATTASGKRVKIVEHVSPKILEETSFYTWLNENGYGDMVKTALDFGKGEFSSKVRQALDNAGAVYVEKQAVHPQTLKAWVKRQLDAENTTGLQQLPDESILKVTRFKTAEVKK